MNAHTQALEAVLPQQQSLYTNFSYPTADVCCTSWREDTVLGADGGDLTCEEGQGVLQPGREPLEEIVHTQQLQDSHQRVVYECGVRCEEAVPRIGGRPGLPVVGSSPEDQPGIGRPSLLSLERPTQLPDALAYIPLSRPALTGARKAHRYSVDC